MNTQVSIPLQMPQRQLLQPETFPQFLNFRSLAGLVGDGGRRIRAGRLFRSGGFDQLSDAGADTLQWLGLGSVCDLRSVGEHKKFPSPLPAAGFPLAMDAPESDPSEATRVVGDPNATPQDVRAAMFEVYSGMPSRFATSLRAVFDAALSCRGGLLVQCAIGKDRTGVAVALLLAALGVPREEILADYTASNRARDAIFDAMAARNPGREPPPAELLAPLLAADPDYLRAFWARLDVDYGGEAGYLISGLGLGADAIGALRARWLI